MVDFTLTEEQVAMQKMARDFAQKEVKPVAMVREKIADPKEAFPVDLFKKSFALGFHKTCIPVKYGGLGLDCLTHVIMWEELGAADAGFCVSLEGHVTTLAFMINAATEEQRQIWLRSVTEGEGGLVAVATTEPNVGPGWPIDDPLSYVMETTARLKGDDWVLNGNKTFCTNGGTPLTKWYTIQARADMTKTGVDANASFLVWPDTPGLTVGKSPEKMGQRLSYNAELFLDDLRVPKSHLVGGKIGTADVATSANRLTTLDPWCTIGGLCLGVARSAYEEALDYAKRRMILGRPAIQFQLVGAKLADMFIQIEAARALAWKAARHSDTEPASDLKLTLATKTMCSDTAVKVASEAVQVFGGIGYTKECLVEKLYRDAKVTQIYEVSNELCRIGIFHFLEWGI
jgi:acyl-CoA dehydrogenase